MGYLDSTELIGHDLPRRFLSRSLKAARNHAYLFVGPEHVGKDAVARAFVAESLNRPVKNWEDLANNPDFVLISRAVDKKNIGVDELRGFIGHFASSPFWGGYKIGVVSGAHDLSQEAANALLKTLEEPAAKSLLVLIATDAGTMPETVKSRCQQVRFLPVPVSKISDGLARRGIAGKVAEEAAALSVGRPGLAVDFAAEKERRKEYSARVKGLLDLAFAEPAARLRRAGELVADALPAELASLLDVWAAVFRDVLSLKAGNPHSVVNGFVSEHIGKYAARKSTADVVRTVRMLFAGKRLLAENVNSRLIFENIALSF